MYCGKIPKKELLIKVVCNRLVIGGQGLLGKLFRARISLPTPFRNNPTHSGYFIITLWREFSDNYIKLTIDSISNVVFIKRVITLLKK
jgi:hypothetical protein